jgi:hypothetical protein
MTAEQWLGAAYLDEKASSLLRAIQDLHTPPHVGQRLLRTSTSTPHAPAQSLTKEQVPPL